MRHLQDPFSTQLLKQFVAFYEILNKMHKGFYASGFLYNPESDRILLQQQISPITSSDWSLFENTYSENENAKNVFTKTIYHALHKHIDFVYPVYSYIDETSGKNQDVFYAISQDTSFPSKEKSHFQWFSFKELTKTRLSEQIRHDILVGQRVIDAAGRKARGEHTFQ